MPVFGSNTLVLTIAGVDLSQYVSSFTINRSFDELEITAMGDLGHKFVKGLEASSISIDLMNDNDTATVIPTLRAAWGTSVVITAKQTSAVVSASNPLYTMSCLVNNTTDINGGVADLSTQSLQFNVNGTIAVTVAP